MNPKIFTTTERSYSFHPLSPKEGLTPYFIGYVGASMARNFDQITAVLSVVTPVE